jgi:hypothetical protein
VLNNPIKYVDPDGESPKLFKTAAKMAWRIYQKAKKFDKMNLDNFKKALKDSGADELVDFAGDFYTLFDPTSTTLDKAQATLDILTGLETNNKGDKAAKEGFEKAKDLVTSKKSVENLMGGTQTASKSLWKGKGKERIDVENPNPGQRKGSIHYQDNDGNKYQYDPKSDTFLNEPKSVNEKLKNSDFRKGVEKALNYFDN